MSCPHDPNKSHEWRWPCDCEPGARYCPLCRDHVAEDGIRLGRAAA